VLYGHQVDLEHPLSFKLNGMEVNGFLGDTILSATIAGETPGAGVRDGYELALDETLAMPVELVGDKTSPHAALPMERTPAVNGAEFVTPGYSSSLGLSGWVDRFTKQARTSLNVDFSKRCPVPGPWFDLPCDEVLEVDLLIVGGGIAGLSAAVQAASTVDSTLLVERRPYCGGDAVLFGQLANESAPDAVISSLKSKLAAAPNVSVFTHSEVLGISGLYARVHRVDVVDGRPRSRILRVSAKKIIIATGSSDRIPVFSGNRLPRVVGLSAAFHLGSAYGVWPSGAFAIVTNNNTAYRFALLANDADAHVEKLMDSRLEPQSRFAEFAKAYGIRSEAGLRPKEVKQDPSSHRLDLQMELAWEGGSSRIKPMQLEGVVVSGGWLPRLSLWQMAGGRITPNETSLALSGTGEVEGVALAGSCSGWHSNSAVMQSGAKAVQVLFGRKPSRIVDLHVDPAFESPDGVLPFGLSQNLQEPPAFFDFGISLASHGGKPHPGFLDGLFGDREASRSDDNFTDRALSLGDLSAMFALGQFTRDEFEVISRERAISPTSLRTSLQTTKETEPGIGLGAAHLPEFLAGRFGANARVWTVAFSDHGQFEVGYLVYASSDIADPRQALGVIVGQTGQGTLALLSQSLCEPGRRVLVLGSRGHRAATVLEEFTSQPKN